MSPLLRGLLYVVALAIVTWLIWSWTRGAQRRRFRKVFPKGNAAGDWDAAEAAFLGLVERAYRLPRNSARNLPREVTPMAIYLTLYPEHCIYDERENERFLDLLRDHLPAQALPKEPLASPLGELARAFTQAKAEATHTL